MNSKLLIVQNNVFFSFQVKKKIVFFILTAHSVMILTLIFFVFMLELLWMCSDSANNTEYSEYSRVHLR